MPTFLVVLLIIALIALLGSGVGYYRGTTAIGNGGVWLATFCVVLYCLAIQLK